MQTSVDKIKSLLLGGKVLPFLHQVFIELVINQIVMKLLLSEKQKRPQRALDLQNDLNDLFDATATRDATRRPRRCRTTPWLRRDRRDGFEPDVKGLLKVLEGLSGALRPSKSQLLSSKPRQEGNHWNLEEVKGVKDSFWLTCGH